MTIFAQRFLKITLEKKNLYLFCLVFYSVTCIRNIYIYFLGYFCLINKNATINYRKQVINVMCIS